MGFIAANWHQIEWVSSFGVLITKKMRGPRGGKTSFLMEKELDQSFFLS